MMRCSEVKSVVEILRSCRTSRLVQLIIARAIVHARFTVTITITITSANTFPVNFFFLLPCLPFESFPVLVLAPPLHLLSLVLEPHLHHSY